MLWERDKKSTKFHFYSPAAQNYIPFSQFALNLKGSINPTLPPNLFFIKLPNNKMYIVQSTDWTSDVWSFVFCVLLLRSRWCLACAAVMRWARESWRTLRSWMSGTWSSGDCWVSRLLPLVSKYKSGASWCLLLQSEIDKKNIYLPFQTSSYGKW